MCAVFNGNSRGEQWMTCCCLRNHIGNTAKASIVLKKLYEKINRQKKISTLHVIHLIDKS